MVGQHNALAAETHDLQTKYEQCKEIQVRLLDWSDQLPLELVLDSEGLPSTLDLHIIPYLFRTFTYFDFAGQASVIAVTPAFLSQMRRILSTQWYRCGGPPFSSATLGLSHLFPSSFLETLAKSDGVEPYARFYLVLAAEEMKRCGDTFFVTYKVLHQLLTKTRPGGTDLPPDLNDIHNDLEARISGHSHLEIFPQMYLILIRVSISDQEGNETEDLVDTSV